MYSVTKWHILKGIILSTISWGENVGAGLSRAEIVQIVKICFGVFTLLCRLIYHTEINASKYHLLVRISYVERVSLWNVQGLNGLITGQSDYHFCLGTLHILDTFNHRMRPHPPGKTIITGITGEGTWIF